MSALTRIAVPDLVTNSYFPALAGEELGFYRAEGPTAAVPAANGIKEAVNLNGGRLRPGRGERRADAPGGVLRTNRRDSH